MTLVPVNVDGAVDASLATDLASAIGRARATPPPAADLVNSDWLDYSLDASLAAKLKIATIDASFTGRIRVYVWDYVRWTAVPDETDPDEQRTIRWGAGIRCAVVASNVSVEGSTSGLAGLAGIAAKVTLSAAQATVGVKALGLRGDHGAIPPPGSLTVEKFGEIVHYATNLAKIINEDLALNPPARTVPQMIGIDTGSALDPVQNAWSVGVVWGLHAIERGWRFQVALDRFPMQQAGPQNPRPDGAIAATYRSILGDRYPELDPDGSARRQAEEQLMNLEIGTR